MLLCWLRRVVVAWYLCSSFGLSQNSPVEHWEGSIREGGRASFFQMDFTTPSAGIYEMLGQRIPFDVVNRDGNHIEIRTRESKPAVFRGERHADRVTGQVVDSQTTAQFWMEREPPLPLAKDRDEAWKQDLAYAARKLPQLDRSFTPATRARYLKQVAELESHVHTLDDPHLMVGLAKAVALADNGHTRLYLVRARTVVRQYPIRVWWFRNELRVIRATPEHSDLLGCEVMKIGMYSASVAFERATPLYSGSQTWAEYMSTYTLTSAEILRGLDLIPDMNHAHWTFRCANGTRSVDLEPMPLQKQDHTVEAWPNLAPRSFEPEQGLVGLQLTSVPPYLSHLEKNYWFEVQGDSGVLYFQFNRCADQADEKISEFGKRLESAWRDPKTRALVIDLRFNTGGNLDLFKDLMTRLQQEAAGRPVYVITGRATFSAGLYHAAQWKQWGKATFIGEPVGDRLDYWSEGGNINLPNSKIAIHFADSFHRYSHKEYPDRKPYFEELSIDSLAPDDPVRPSFVDYAAGRDPAMGIVLGGLTRAAKIR